jgi:hypothetical protein
MLYTLVLVWAMRISFPTHVDMSFHIRRTAPIGLRRLSPLIRRYLAGDLRLTFAFGLFAEVTSTLPCLTFRQHYPERGCLATANAELRHEEIYQTGS